MITIANVALMGLFVWPIPTPPAGTWAEVKPVVATIQLAETQPLAMKIAKESKTISVKMTGYNAVPEQTDADPTTTASGARSNPDIIAARSNDLADELPFGTVIAIEAPKGGPNCGYSLVEDKIGYRVIADAMHERMKQKVDVMFDHNEPVSVKGKRMNPAIALGVCDANVRVVGKISLKDIPASQSGLVSVVENMLSVK